MRIQSPLEEKLNASSHAIGILLGIVGLILLVLKDSEKSYWSLESVIVYGLTLIILFSTSTLYHATTHPGRKHVFRVLDHISIYSLIAGTYTPVCLITLEEGMGWTILFVVWGIALFGTILKLFFTGKYELLSTLLYLAMGWLIVLDFSSLSEHIHPDGLVWLFIGGMAYTLGIIFYTIEKIPFNHVIWHFLVLVGAISHFIMIYLYVI